MPRMARNRITTAYATLPDAHHVVVKVDAAGLTGLGEAPTERWWTGEDAASARNAIERYLAPSVVGTPVGPRDAARRMGSALAGNPYAKAAVEMAMWDLVGKVAGLPLHALLGGGYPRPLAVKYVIGFMEPDQAHEEAHQAVESGFRVLKVKVGGDLASDLARVRAVHDALPPGGSVGVDANGGWSLPVALGALDPLHALGISFLEQPVPSAAPGAMAAITARAPMPIVAHESIFTLSDGVRAASERWAHVWALTPSTHGGVGPTLELASIARATGVPCLLGSTLELGVATAMLAHVGAALDVISDCPIPSDVIGPLYHQDDIVAAAPTISEGFVNVPTAPGLGVELDEARVRAYQVNE